MSEFTIPKDPTNNDIMLFLVRMNDKLDRVEAQALKTNGRVNSIEEWKTGLQAVAAFQEKNPQSQQINAPNATTVVVQPQKWFQSKELVGGIVAFLTVIGTVLLIVFGGNAQ